MPQNKSSTCDCLKYDVSLFGKKTPSNKTLETWKSKGWLSENGICFFPRDVQAHPSGVITPFPIKFWENPNEDQYIEAIEKGWIKFIDGDGKKHTLEEYKQKYPEYPNPYYILRLEKRFPPKVSDYVDLENKETQKEITKFVFRMMI